MSALFELEYPLLLIFIVLMSFAWVRLLRHQVGRRRQLLQTGDELLKQMSPQKPASDDAADGDTAAGDSGKMKFCNQCQIKHQWNAKYCRNCGRDL